MSLVDVNSGDVLSLQRMHVSVYIASAFSRTRITVEFRNHLTTCVNEAEFVAVLRDGTSVCGFAKEVNGQLVDAVAVPKEKARTVFAAETRTASKHKTSVVGASISFLHVLTHAEQHGNSFKTKLNMIPSLSSVTMQIDITTPLNITVEKISRGRIKVLTYELPLKDKFGEIPVTVETRIVCIVKINNNDER
jgi:hypothetical protein